ncbi:MAG: hypothetical protein LUF90_01175 [Rikenellaceae bacterium]|nr:hypothetical protein [Rikenellaceae bacterium]
MAPNIESNQPNQGGIIEGPDGIWYFLTHHGKGDWEGRAVSLLPVTWIDEWPVIGEPDSNGWGHMVWFGNMPIEGSFEKDEFFCDDFTNKNLDTNWEWNYYPNNEMWSLSERSGWLRLKAMKPLQKNNLKKVPNILTQRVYRTKYNEVTIKMDITGMKDGQIAGLCHYAATYAYIGIKKKYAETFIIFNENENIESNKIDTENEIWLRSVWGLDGICRFYYSMDGKKFQDFGKEYRFTWGNYRGTRIGLFTFNEKNEEGLIDIDYFEYRKK